MCCIFTITQKQRNRQSSLFNTADFNGRWFITHCDFKCGSYSLLLSAQGIPSLPTTLRKNTRNKCTCLLLLWMIKAECTLACWRGMRLWNSAEMLRRVTQSAISGFSLSSNVFCMRLQKSISAKTLNKWDNPLSSVHMLMPILMKYTVKENKGGWYHRRQRKTSGFSACMMQDRHILPLKDCCTVSPLPEMLTQRQALLLRRVHPLGINCLYII